MTNCVRATSHTRYEPFGINTAMATIAFDQAKLFKETTECAAGFANSRLLLRPLLRIRIVDRLQVVLAFAELILRLLQVTAQLQNFVVQLTLRR